MITGMMMATPTSMNLWLDAGAAASQIVTARGTRYGNMLIPSPTKFKRNSARVMRKGSRSAPRRRLQTKIAEGQENPLSLIQIAKLYEVQKYVSMTSHMWDGFWMLANRQSFESMPKPLQDTVAQQLNRSALDERADIARLNDTVTADLKTKGLTFVEVDKAEFRAALKQAKFYAEWKTKYGDEAWGLLEDAVGSLS